MLVYRTIEKKSFGNLTLLLCKIRAIICYCFVHQHGRLITWLQTIYWSLFKQELACGKPPKGGQWRMQILFPICPRSSFFVQYSTKVHRVIRTQLLVSWLGRDLPLIFIPKPPVNEQVPTWQTAKHLDITTVFTYSRAKMPLGANQSTQTILVIL